LDFTYGKTHVGKPRELFSNQAKPISFNERSEFEREAREAIGSNEWAISPSRTSTGSSMLLINPHQPWYGWGQFYEVHIHSEESLRFSGACFLGTPIPTIGHNEKLGWTYTVNNPDTADAWSESFDNPKDPLAYRYEDGYRKAEEFTETIRIKRGQEMEQREVIFRKTHHGPVVRKDSETTFISANVAGVFNTDRFSQGLAMARAQNLEQWRQAMNFCSIPMFNVAYADCEGNILYAYNGSIPRRNPEFDWRRPVDGTIRDTEWQGLHSFDELPQVLNPKCGYVQNCNTSPFLTTENENPERSKYPDYMFEDADHEKRRAQLSREILGDLKGLTFEDFQGLAMDTRLYWPKKNLDRFKDLLEQLEKEQPEKAARVKPYLEHLLQWNCVATNDSTATTLCVYWYEELHQGTYPGETLKNQYKNNDQAQLLALAKAARTIESLHGSWKVGWGTAHRLQRAYNKPDVQNAGVSFNGFIESLPCPGAPGPLGIVYTVYSTPTVPIVRPTRYAVVGSCYVAAIEFGAKVRAATAVPYGTSGNPRSKHYFDQANLFSEKRLKPAWFYPEDVLENATSSYHPGENWDWKKK
ncbi:MAG: penicillin acylase family protein, partial [Planctomycetota bacterium]